MYLRLEIIKKTISLIILLIVAPFGIIAICCSQIVYSWIAIYLNTYYTDKLFGISLWMQIKDFSKYLIASLVSWTPAFIFVLMGVNNYICIVFGTLLAISLYSIVLLRKDLVFIEIREMILTNVGKKIKRD